MSPHHHRPPPESGWRLWLWHAERVWQDLIPLIALILAAVAVFGTQSDVERQREGRAVAVDVFCGVTNGITGAGAETLTDTLPGTEAFQRPHSRKERKIARIYANAYAQAISLAVTDQVGVQAGDVLRPDGTLNCEALKRAARTQPQPR